MKMRHLLIALPMLLGTVTAANAEISVNIGINVPVYPQLVPVPGYPVYYNPRGDSNYFFYDGLYWVYREDNWYASSWYNGPWDMTEPEFVPLYVLRVPVRYYVQPPLYFRGWRADAPPRWGDHWGREWEQRRNGWDRWDHRSAPARAPLPVYQRQYSGSRYPRAAEQQQAIRSDSYRYQPREAVTQQHFEPRGNAGAARAEPQRLQRSQPVQVQPGRDDRNGHDNRSEPRESGRDQRAEPQQRGREQRAEPQQRGGREQQVEPQQRGRENIAEPQSRGRESLAEPQGRGRENRSAPQDRERDNKNEERGQDRH
jgi:hypothetical protein